MDDRPMHPLLLAVLYKEAEDTGDDADVDYYWNCLLDAAPQITIEGAPAESVNDLFKAGLGGLFTLASWGSVDALDLLIELLPDEPKPAPRPVQSRSSRERVARLGEDVALNRFLSAAYEVFGDEAWTSRMAVEQLGDALPVLPVIGNPIAHLGTWLRGRRGMTTAAGRRVDCLGKSQSLPVDSPDWGRNQYRITITDKENSDA
ncbi:hypothetical protein ACNHYB_06160 [Isoptericola jiangsuensis]|uniref:hypothetical protein n=1 Tax=Isoptericola jiangsuensis TaxID=548579 RepID=UPI003AADCBEC